MKKTGRKSVRNILAVFMAVAVCISFMPTFAFASDETLITVTDPDNSQTKITESDWAGESFTSVTDVTYYKCTYSGGNLSYYPEICSGITLKSVLVYALECDWDELESNYGSYVLNFVTKSGTMESKTYTIANLLSERKAYSGSTDAGSVVDTILSLNDGSVSMRTGQMRADETNGSYWISDITGIKIVNPQTQGYENVDADYSNADVSWYDASKSSYEIGTTQQLLGLAKKVNEDAVDFAGKTVKLTAGIDMNEMAWSPIGDQNHQFKGTFDGNGEEIKNIKIIRSKDFCGLFGYNLGVIKNVKLSGTVTANGEIDYIGCLVGFNAGTIENVISDATVTGNDSFNVGGICGINVKGQYVGKDSEGTEITCSVSGSTGKINKCANKGTITGSKKEGGITGENAGEISECCNTATITGTNNSSKNGVGGIAGRNGNNNTAVETGTITSCYNTGEIGIADQKWTGGITGFNNSKSGITNCYNTGKIVSTKGYSNPITGLCEANTSKVSNNYSLEGLNHTTPDSESDTVKAMEIGIVKTATELKSNDFLTLINGTGSAFTTDVDSSNGGYPILTWQTADLCDHEWETGEKVSVATCCKKAVYEYTCSKCGKTKEEEFGEVDKSNHVHVKIVNARAAGCTSGGYTGDKVCTDCNALISKGSATAARGHRIIKTKKVNSTCCKYGSKSHYECVYCHQCYKDKKGKKKVSASKYRIKKKKHSYTKKIVASRYLKKAATKKSPAIYKKACKWCGKAGSKTFKYGKKLK